MVNRSVIFLLPAFLLSGCAHSGALFTDVTQPATRDFTHTPAGKKECVVSVHQVREPVTHMGISVEWSQEIVQQAAADCGITNLCFADLRTRSYIFGIYRQRQLILHGE